MVVVSTSKVEISKAIHNWKSADWSLIVTFAESDNSDDIEHNLFHESVHKVDLEDIPDGGKLGQWFWDNADSI